MQRSLALVIATLITSLLVVACGGGAAAPTPSPTLLPPATATVAVPATSVPTATVEPSPTRPAATATTRPAATATTRPAAAAAPTRPITPPGGPVVPDQEANAVIGALSPNLVATFIAGGLTGRANPVNEVKPGGATRPGQPTAVAKPPQPTPTRTIKAGLKSYRVVGEMTGPEVGKIDLTYEYAGPGRARLVAKVDSAKAARKPRPGEPTEFELIIIDQVLYMNDGKGWVKTDYGKGGGPKPEDLDIIWQVSDGLARSKGEVKPVGQEVINGEPCLVYTQVEGMKQTDAKVWVSSQDQMIRKLDIKDGKMAVVFTVEAVNEPITIEPPANARSIG